MLSSSDVASCALAAVVIAAAALPAAAQSPVDVWDGQSPEVAFGASLAAAGDVDGDGTPDLLVGAPNSLGFRGAARVLSGADGDTVFTYLNANPEGKPLDWFGEALTTCGDVDGDGLSEFAIGQANVGALMLGGRVRVYRGSDGSVLRSFTATVPGQQLGAGLADVGDVDGDGLDDLAIGAATSDAVAPNAGAVFIHSGATGELLRTLGGFVSPDDSLFGSALAGAGDYDLDGVPDVAVGAPGYYGGAGNTNAGLVVVMSGATGSLLLSDVGDLQDRLGWAVAGGQDVDRNGVPDVLAGAPEYVGLGGSGPGHANLYAGETGDVLKQFTGQSFQDGCGWSVALADFDLDGSSDVLIGDPYYPAPGHFKSGRVRVWSGWDWSLLAEVQGDVDNEQLGAAVAAIGNLDDDLAPEWVAGAPNNVSGGSGQVQVFAGESAWTQLQLGLAGEHGVPVASAAGALLPGRVVEVSLQGAAHTSLTTLLLGLSAISAPFKGGVLVPNPDLLLPLPMFLGSVTVSGDWPANLPSGLQFWLQFWTADAAAVHGLSASNALMGTAD